MIDCHRDGLVPLGAALTGDGRCTLGQGNFFALARTGLDIEIPGRRFDAVLPDIDLSPEHVLDQANRSLYTPDGLVSIADQLKPGGSFALWSNDPASEAFNDGLKAVFETAEAHNVEFPNPYTNSTAVNSVYVSRKAG